ncbi:MAG: oxidoreductase [Cyanobacteria bacterium RYN_339]|nr:oxidoreductase [Cyanobacteria bacterium RYN_339]
MALPLADRVAVVTGASSGIGRAIALHLADQGARVVVNHKDAPEAAEAVVAEIRRLGGDAAAIAADVTQREQVQALVARAELALGPVDVLVNNVGGLIERRPFQDFDDALWERIMDLNLKSAFLGAQAVLPGMIARKRGQIVNISSIAAETGAPDGSIPYAAAKAGLNAMTIGLAREVAPHGIRVNAVSPGLIATPFHAGNERSFSQRIAAIPLGRIGEPEEVARVVGYLVSDAAGFITGQVWTVAGGR